MWYWKNVSMVKNMFSQPRWPPGLSILFMSAESISGSMDVWMELPACSSGRLNTMPPLPGSSQYASAAATIFSGATPVISEVWFSSHGFR